MRKQEIQSGIMLTTPHGHSVTLEMDDEDFAVRHAKVVNHYTGIIKSLDGSLLETLTNAMRAKRVYEEALGEVRNIERTLKGFGSLAEALGRDHPALEPYIVESEKHKAIARDMFLQARTFQESAMEAIDAIADAKQGAPSPAHTKH